MSSCSQQIKIKRIPTTVNAENVIGLDEYLGDFLLTTSLTNSACWDDACEMVPIFYANSSNWQETYAEFSSQSANNISLYSTVNSNSATNWNYQGSDIKSLTGNWQNTYVGFYSQSANNISVYSTVNSNSSNYNSVYNTVNTNSALNWNYQGTDLKVLTSNWEDTYNTVQDYSALWIIDNAIDTGVRSLTSNWQNTYTNFSIQSANNISVYNSFNSNSSNYNSVYNTVQNNSATTWNYQGSDIKSLTSNWQNTYTNFSIQSGDNISVYNTVQDYSALWIIDNTIDLGVRSLTSNWEDTYNTVQDYSALWIIDNSIDTGVRSLTSNWQNTYNTVQSNSGNWNYQGTDIKSLTSNWQNTYTNFSIQSGNNISVYNSFNSNSSNYNSAYNTVQSNSSTTWNYQGTDIKALTSDWEDTYNTVQSNSSLWAIDSTIDSGVRALTGNWEDTYNTVQDYSALWIIDNSIDTGVRSLTSNWQNTYINFSTQSANNIGVYNTVNSNSALWVNDAPQTLTFNNINAELTISGGNTVSLSSLSGGGNGSTGVSYLSALSDVSIPSPVNGQVLTYNSITGKWNAGSPLSASGATGYYGSFYDTTAQTLTSTTQDKRINIAQTYEHNGVSLDSNKIVFNYNGVYEIIYSIQYKNTSNSQQDIYIWLKQNGNDIPNSSSVFTIPAHKNASIPAQLIAVSPFMSTLTAGDFIELYWHCNNTAVTIETFTTHTSPTIPDTPGVIVTVKQVTNVQIVPTVGAYLPLSGGTLTGAVSTTNVLYTSGGNSDQWNSVYNTVNSNSAINWNYQGTDLKSLTSNWQSTYISFQSQSANNALVFTNVNSNSANWNSSYTTVNLNSATTWNYQGTDLKALSSVWQSASLVTQSQSANNSSVYTNVNGNSANWNSSYTTVNTNSASWLNSGSGDANVNSFVYSQSANILSTNTTVQTNSASWGTGGGVPQTLSFNENNAELTISSGNTVSLSSLSGGTSGGGSGVSIQGNIAYNRWQFTGSPPISSFNITGSQSEIEESFRVTVDSVIQDPFNYTVSGNFITFSESPLLSSNIVVVETYVVPDESPLVVHQYQRWFHTGNGSTSAFDISGAFLTDRFAYRVTVDYLLQDPLSYTIDLSQSSLVFSESPPLSSEIVIVEQYHTSLTAVVSSFTTPVTASGDFLIVRVNNVDRAIRLWDF